MTRYFSIQKTSKDFLPFRNRHISWIGALPDRGRVEIIGQFIGIPTQPPITEIPCLFWQLDTYEQVRVGRSSNWKSEKQEYSKERFEIDDGTGKIQALPVHIDLVVNELSYSDPIGLIVESYIASGEEVFLTGELLQHVSEKYVSGTADTPMHITYQNEHDALRGLNL